MLLLLACS